MEGQAKIAEPDKKIISFNFGQLDQSQKAGQTLAQWEKSGLLLKMVTRLKDHGVKPLYQCLDSKFKCYGAFPPRSEFKKPLNIAPDAQWASMHIQGRECIAGHIVHDMFFVVFLDEDHKFWPVEKPNS
jgi:hypothetical protein